jgi:hypothetical protein
MCVVKKREMGSRRKVEGTKAERRKAEVEQTDCGACLWQESFAKLLAAIPPVIRNTVTHQISLNGAICTVSEHVR